MRKVFPIGVVAVVVLAALIVNHQWPEKPVPPVPDRLCSVIRAQFPAMECVQTLVASTLMKPGAEVEMIGGPEARRVDIPRADLFGETCRVPGAPTNALTGETFQRADVAVPEVNFKVDRTLKAGTEVPLPKLQHVTLSAGPDWKNVVSARFASEKTSIVQIDENVAADALNNCYVKLDCVERAIKSNYRIVSGVIVAERVNFSLLDEHARVLSVDAKSKEINASFGGRSDVRSESDATLRVSSPTTLAVRFIPEEIVKARLASACLEPIKFFLEGSTSVSVAGAGGRGNIGSGVSATRALGEEAVAQAAGRERSECQEGSGRTISQGRARGKVDAIGTTGLRLSYDLLAQGGHYRTGTCVLGKLVGFSGHDNGTTVAVDLRGTIRVVLRTATIHLMSLRNSLQRDVQVVVRDSEGKQIKEIVLDPREKPPAGFPTDDPNARIYRLTGPAVYVVEASAKLAPIVSGAAGHAARKEVGDITVVVAP